MLSYTCSPAFPTLFVVARNAGIWNADVYKCLGMINTNVGCPSFSVLVKDTDIRQISMGNTLLKVNISFKKLAA